MTASDYAALIWDFRNARDLIIRARQYQGDSGSQSLSQCLDYLALAQNELAEFKKHGGVRDA